MVFMAAMAATSVATSLIGAGSASAAAKTQAAQAKKAALETSFATKQNAIEQANIEQSSFRREMDNRAFNMSFNEELLTFNQSKADLDFNQQFIQRLEGYNKVRGVQIASLGYQGRTVSSLNAVNASQEHDWNFDNEVDELNRQMVQISLSLGQTQDNMNQQRDQESTFSAINASKAAQGATINMANLNMNQTIESANNRASAQRSAAWTGAVTGIMNTAVSLGLKYGPAPKKKD